MAQPFTTTARRFGGLFLLHEPQKITPMKTRIVKNWRTTLLGTALLIIAIVLLIFKTLTGGEFIALLPTILGLLFMPDTVFKIHRRD